MEPIDRRRLLQSAGAGLLILNSRTAFAYQANSALEIGIVGCGGRGNYVGDFFVEYTGARVVAVADPIAVPLDKARAKYRIDAARAYDGLEGYRKLADSNLDAVLVMSPPYFHPIHARAAAEAGKHVYLAKPVAADTAGCLSIEESGRLAEGKRSFWVDFQTRAQPVFQQAAERVHRGDLGTLGFGQTYYHTSIPSVPPIPGLSPAQARLRHWLGDKVLSGDIIVEQHIHSIDVGNWYLNGHPIKAYGHCGRRVRTFGDCNDFFAVQFWYPGNIMSDHSSVQFTKGYNDICARVFGAKGTVDSHYGGLVHITGDNAWHGADKDDTFREGAITNVKRFVESIRSGAWINNAAQASESTLTAILGREASYRGGELTWDQLLAAKQQYSVNLT
jgi:predicted dehydrogenase